MKKAILSIVLLGLLIPFGMLIYKSYQEEVKEQEYLRFCKEIETKVKANPENVMEYCRLYFVESVDRKQDVYRDVIIANMNEYESLKDIDRNIESENDKLRLATYISLHNSLCTRLNMIKDQWEIEEKIIDGKVYKKDTVQLLVNITREQMLVEGRKIYLHLLQNGIKDMTPYDEGSYELYLIEKEEKFIPEPYEDLGEKYNNSVIYIKAKYDRMVEQSRKAELAKMAHRKDYEYRRKNPAVDREIMRDEIRALEARLAAMEAEDGNY